MRVVRHADPHSFLRRAQSWLEREEAENNVILGICSQLVDRPSEFSAEPLLLTFEDRKATSGVAVMTPPRELVTSSWPIDHAAAVTGYLAESRPSLTGLFGPTPQAQAVVREWGRLFDGTCRLSMQHTLYECRAVRQVQTSAGILRAATVDDTKMLSQWRREFIVEVGIDESKERAERVIERAITAGNLFVWQDVQVVSAAAVGRESRRGATITFVYTPPNCRGRGYATSCVSAVTRGLLDRGKRFVALFADPENVVSNGIYRRIGYKRIRDFQLWHF